MVLIERTSAINCEYNYDEEEMNYNKNIIMPGLLNGNNEPSNAGFKKYNIMQINRKYGDFFHCFYFFCIFNKRINFPRPITQAN